VGYPWISMRKIELIDKKIKLSDNVEVFYEKTVTSFGNSAKVDAPKKYIGKRAYVIILKK
jgi:putative transposon-encoded protein